MVNTRKELPRQRDKKIKELNMEGEISVKVPDEELAHFTSANVVSPGLGLFTTMDLMAGKLFETKRALNK